MSQAHILSLVSTPEEARRIAEELANIIGASFLLEERHLKLSEVKRRYAICARIFCDLVSDAKWGVQRALHYLPTYLRCELDGIPWEPDKRAIWLPNEA